MESDQVGMGGLFQRETQRERETEREREREVMKEKEGLCHLLCAEGRGEGEQTSLAKESGGDGDGEAGREVYIWSEKERKRDKKHEGGSEVERDLVPVWQPCFFYTSSVGSPLHGNSFDLRQCVTDREDWVCVQIDRECVCVCVCVCVSQPLSVQHLFCASVAAAVSHTVS